MLCSLSLTHTGPAQRLVMIRVVLAPEPSDSDHEVRQMGHSAMYEQIGCSEGAARLTGRSHAGRAR